MATAVVETGEDTPLSLYIQLAPHTRADLEVISRAALAWSRMIKEAAFVVEPFAEVRVELVSGTEGSINLNSLIRKVKGILSDPNRLKTIALAAALYFAGQAQGWVIGKGFDGVWDWLRETVGLDAASLPDEQRVEIEDAVSRVLTSKSVAERAAAVYAELPRDPNITGVGVSFKAGERPAHIVPRAEFHERAGIQGVSEELIPRRIEVNRLTLVLVAPVLSDGEYKWKFLYRQKTLWALMDDPDFLARIAPGSRSAPHMMTGIRMSVDLETVQEMKDGVWTITKQRITKVHGLEEPPKDVSWLDSPSDDE